LKATEVQKLLQQTLAEEAVNLDSAEADVEIQHQAAS
jgi:hypothetical protein